MRYLKKLLDFYISGSIHVALAVFALTKMTQMLFSIEGDNASAWFAFFGTIVGYNFVKYDALARIRKVQVKGKLKAIVMLSAVSLLATGYFFLQLQPITQVLGILFLVVTMLYTLPFFPNRKNARNWAGVKIYMVAICWVGVSLFLPIINSGIPIGFSILQVAVQRFILVFVWILVFEIIDMQADDPHLRTVPQQIGVWHTKVTGNILLFIFLLLELLTPQFDLVTFLIKAGIAVTSLFFLLFAHEKKSKYYTSFWVESIPILWWVVLLILNGG